MNSTIDLRSDTVTKPTPGMLKAMMNAPVGDDVFGEDPTINALQDRLAEMFGKEAALFCPSGTMANQMAINVHTRPGDEVICADIAHVFLYEGGGIARNSGAQALPVAGDLGRLKAVDVKAAIRPFDSHYARTSLVCLEDTVNKGGGCCYDFEDIMAISRVCERHRLGLHLDGARLFNALAVSGMKPDDYGRPFDSISICLSKGLGAPVGSVLIGSREMIGEAHRARKVMGGGMRQAGILAAAGLYALDNHVERLTDDHRRAAQLAEALAESDWVEQVLPCVTNIVIFQLKEGLHSSRVTEEMHRNGLLCAGFGPRHVRFVTHLDFDEEQLNRAIQIIRGFSPKSFG